MKVKHSSRLLLAKGSAHLLSSVLSILNHIHLQLTHQEPISVNEVVKLVSWLLFSHDQLDHCFGVNFLQFTIMLRTHKFLSRKFIHRVKCMVLIIQRKRHAGQT